MYSIYLFLKFILFLKLLNKCNKYMSLEKASQGVACLLSPSELTLAT